MDGGGVRQRRASGVLNVHFPADRYGEVARLETPCQSAQAVGFDLETGASIQFPCTKMIAKIMQTLIQQHGLANLAGNVGALLEGFARLLHPAQRVGDGIENLQRNRGHPRAIDVVSDVLACQPCRADGFNALDVFMGVTAAQFRRVRSITKRTGFFDTGNHLRRCACGY